MTDGKAHLFEPQAQICKTLADANRIMILHELRSGERSVGQLVASLGLAQSNVSHHLAILRDKSIVLTRREATTIYYRLADERIGAACDLVRDILRGNLIRGEELAWSLALSGITGART